jgi:transcriptional antiterminator NusG
MNDDTWYVVRNTRGVTGFVGPGSKPVPLTEEEMFNMGLKREQEVVYEFEVGDTVQVVSGVWENTEGIVRVINREKKSLTISIDMFGRETPVEIGFEDVRVDK